MEGRRQAGRPCRLFAFGATPTRRALRALRDASVSWVEVGAGSVLGAAMESSFGMDVVALDKTPNTEGFGGDSPGGGEWDEGAMNEYHGRAASFVKVREGGPRDLRRYKTGLCSFATRRQATTWRRVRYANTAATSWRWWGSGMETQGTSLLLESFASRGTWRGGCRHRSGGTPRTNSRFGKGKDGFDGGAGPAGADARVRVRVRGVPHVRGAGTTTGC